METMPISKFKATCLAAIERVRRDGETLVITKRGVPIAQVTAVEPAAPPKSAFGSMAHLGRVTGDIVGPSFDEDDLDPEPMM